MGRACYARHHAKRSTDGKGTIPWKGFTIVHLCVAALVAAQQLTLLIGTPHRFLQGTFSARHGLQLISSITKKMVGAIAGPQHYKHWLPELLISIGFVA